MKLPEVTNNSEDEVNPYQFQHSISNNLSIDQNKESESKGSRYTGAQWLTLVTLSFANFCLGACVSLQAPFFPKEAEKKGATPTEYGLIYGMYQLTIFVIAPIMGKMISFAEPKVLLNSGIFVVGVTCICFGLLDMVYHRAAFVTLAFVIRILEGVGAASWKTSSFAIIAVQFEENVGTTFVGGFGLPFYAVGSLILLDALVICFVLPNPRRSSIQEKGNFIKFWCNSEIMVYALDVFTSYNYIGYIEATLEPHIRQFKLSGAYLGMLFALAGTVYAVTAPIWGWLCDKKYDCRLLCIFGCCVHTLSLLLVGPMPFLHLKSQLSVTIAALALIGISASAKLVPAFSGSMRETIARGFPPDITTYGLISSMIASSQSLGAFVGPSLGGYLMETIGYNAGTALLISLECFLIVVLMVITCIKKHQSTKEDEKCIIEGKDG